MELKIEQMQQYELDMLHEIDLICRKNGIPLYLVYGSVIGAIRHKGFIPWDYDTDIAVPYNCMANLIKALRLSLPKKYYVDYHDKNKHYCHMFPRVGLTGYDTKKLHIDVFPLIGLPPERQRQEKLCYDITKVKILNKYKSIRLEGSFLGVCKKMLYKVLLLPISKKALINKYEKMCAQYDYDHSDWVMNPCGHEGIKNILEKKVFGEGLRVPYEKYEAPIPSMYDDYLKRFYGDYMTPPPMEDRSHPEVFQIIEYKDCN